MRRGQKRDSRLSFSNINVVEKLTPIKNASICFHLPKLWNSNKDKHDTSATNSVVYQCNLYPCLCGCRNMTKLFCWLCSPFSKRDSEKMNSLYTTTDQHKPSATHFQCTLNILHLAGGWDNKWETLENNIKFRSSGQSKIFCSNRVVLILLTDVTYRLEIQELLLGVKMNLVYLVTEATTETRCNFLKSTSPSEGSQYSNEHLFKITCSTQSTRWYWMKLENKGKRLFCCSWVGLRMLR